MASAEIKLSEQTELGPGFRRLFSASLFVGGGALVLSMLVGYFTDHTLRRFYFGYLVNFMFFLTIALGALFFVLLQHITRAGWSVAVRRIAETMAAILPVLAALAAPIIVSVITQRGDLYPWAQQVHTGSPHVEQK